MTSIADRSAATAFDIVSRLRAVHTSGRTLPLEWRKRQLEGIVRLVTESEAEFADTLAADLGRTPHETWFADIASTVGEAEYALKHLKKWMKPVRTGVPLALMPGRAAYRHEPLGTVMVIGPWNYPLHLTLAPLIAAVAAGNCCVVKPSEHAPATSSALARLIPEYLDSAAVAVVEGDGRVTHELIDARLDLVFFTGGTEIGRKIAAACARHLTPVVLELGGKSPVVVTRHADIGVAARRIAFVKLINSGQTCIAPDYVLVEKNVRADFTAELSKTIAAFRAGAPERQPIVNDRQYQRLCSLLDGQSPVVGGDTDANDLAMEPTVLVNPDRTSPVMQGEIFGPILPILDVDSLDHAIEIINEGEKPLAAYLFTKDRSEIERFFSTVPCGGAVSNHIAMHALAPQLPFGGVGNSGMGAYHGKWGYETFSHRKATLKMPVKPDLRLMYPPYSERDKKILRRLA